MKTGILSFAIFWVSFGAIYAEDAEISSATKSVELSCPTDMVEIEGRYCIDRYEFPNEKGKMPQGGVTWLQALARCASQGKRLCTSAEWQRACSGASGFIYPYGDEFDRRRCLSARKHDRGAAPSGSHPECVSEEGVYDLSGNLWEWVGTRPEEAALAGGGWMTDGDHSRCDSRAWTGVPRSTNFTYGFRCCLSLKDDPSSE